MEVRKATFIVPGDAVPWKAPEVKLRGKFRIGIMPKRASEQKGYMKFIAAQAWEGQEPMEGPVKLEINIYKGIPKSYSKKKRDQLLNGNRNLCSATPDVTNVVKLVEDAIKGIIIKDDRQVCFQVNKRFWRENGMMEVTVTELLA
jgi:Holliday junction resolvase RusA-like endonuclease